MIFFYVFKNIVCIGYKLANYICSNVTFFSLFKYHNFIPYPYCTISLFSVPIKQLFFLIHMKTNLKINCQFYQGNIDFENRM